MNSTHEAAGHLETDLLLALARRDFAPARPEALRHLAGCEECRGRFRDLESAQAAARALARADAGAYDVDCPDETALVGFERGTLPRREAAEVALHLAICDPCRHQVETLEAELALAVGGPPVELSADLRRRALAVGERAAKEARATAAGRGGASSRASGRAAATGGLRAWIRGAFVPRRLAPVAAFAILAAVSVTLLLRETRGPSTPPVRSAGERGGVLLGYPAEGAAVAVGGLTLEWTAVPAALDYRVTVSGPDGATLWEETVSGPTARPPASLGLLPGRTYYWQVEARTMTGGARVSERRSFTVR